MSSKLAVLAVAIASALVSLSVQAAAPVYQRENVAWALTSVQPSPWENITYDDDMDILPSGVDFVLPSRLLRSIPTARITRVDDGGSSCRVVGIIRSGRNYVIRVETDLAWDEQGCDVTISVQSVRGPKRITYQLQQIGS